ncbi:MAG: 50S ribosomal protein L29 [Bdellovibrionota bacterium]
MAHRISKQKKEIAAAGVKDLFTKTRELEDHIFQLRMQAKTGQLPSTAMMMIARKELARVKTAITAKAASAKKA